jgi:hypothetical protein
MMTPLAPPIPLRGDRPARDALGAESHPRPHTMARKISASELAADVRNGMSDADLMRKYEFTPRALRSAFTRLLDKQYIEASHLKGRLKQFESPIIVEGARAFPRVTLDTRIPVYEISGHIVNLSEGGFRLTGTRAVPGEIRNFILPLDDMFIADRIAVRARCAWANDEGDAGFEIVEISKAHMRELKRVMQSLSFDEDSIIFENMPETLA